MKYQFHMLVDLILREKKLELKMRLEQFIVFYFMDLKDEFG